MGFDLSTPLKNLAQPIVSPTKIETDIDDPEAQAIAQRAHDLAIGETLDASYRFVVCVDVPAVSLQRAYDRLLDRMRHAKYKNDWETTDEAYGPDGESIYPSTLQAAIVAELERRAGEENS